jgi:hypothetical protein
MAASPFNLATPERASRLLRLLILILLVLIPVAAIYALAMGGVAGRDTISLHTDEGMDGDALRLPLGAGRHEIIERYATTNGNRQCTRTEHDLKPGEQPAAPSIAPTAPPALQHGNFIKADFTPAASAAVAGSRVVRTTETGPHVAWAFDNRPQAGAPADAALSLLALLLLLGTLFNLERLLQAFETGSVFAERTVRRLQHVGIFVAALGFLPQIDIFALLRNAALSLVTPAPVGPLPLGLGGVNIALILAGVFTVLIARIVHEANVLAEDVRGTV